jgi:chemotaxis protein CheD
MAQANVAVQTHYLFPCMVFTHREEHLVTTVLGSCVAVCLWDSAMGMGGINHYMLALWNGDGLPTPKYGNIANETLVRSLLDQGCTQSRLVAKLFGGANVLQPCRGHFDVGGRNIAIAREMLAQHQIPITAEDVGGDYGRRIIFNTRTGLVLVSRLRPILQAQ